MLKYVGKNGLIAPSISVQPHAHYCIALLLQVERYDLLRGRDRETYSRNIKLRREHASSSSHYTSLSDMVLIVRNGDADSIDMMF